jgi:hypothetical protein
MVALDISRPVRCERCRTKFTRTHGRQRFCTSCIPNWRRTRAVLRLAERAKAAVAAEQERLRGGYVSPGCQEPRMQQAEILLVDQWRRHPYDGPRPQWSGWCLPPGCACSCHGMAALWRTTGTEHSGETGPTGDGAPGSRITRKPSAAVWSGSARLTTSSWARSAFTVDGLGPLALTAAYGGPGSSAPKAVLIAGAPTYPWPRSTGRGWTASRLT